MFHSILEIVVNILSFLSFEQRFKLRRVSKTFNDAFFEIKDSIDTLKDLSHCFRGKKLDILWFIKYEFANCVIKLLENTNSYKDFHILFSDELFEKVAKYELMTRKAKLISINKCYCHSQSKFLCISCSFNNLDNKDSLIRNLKRISINPNGLYWIYKKYLKLMIDNEMYEEFIRCGGLIYLFFVKSCDDNLRKIDTYNYWSCIRCLDKFLKFFMKCVPETIYVFELFLQSNFFKDFHARILKSLIKKIYTCARNKNIELLNYLYERVVFGENIKQFIDRSKVVHLLSWRNHN